jgi:hypothetical protein
MPQAVVALATSTGRSTTPSSAASNAPNAVAAPTFVRAPQAQTGERHHRAPWLRSVPGRCPFAVALRAPLIEGDP